MRIKCLEKKIFIFKGTNAEIIIPSDIFESPYDVALGDSFSLQVIDYRDEDKVILEKTITGGMTFEISPEDTEELSVGFYRWNVKFAPENSSDIYEVIQPSVFHIKASE